MKKTALLLLGLIVVAWLLVEYLRKPVAAIDSTPVPTPEATEPANFSAPVPASLPQVTDNLTESNAPAEVEVPAFEGFWAKERRELLELAAKDPDAALAQVAQMPEKEERMNALKAVCLQVAEKDPAKAMTSAWRLQLGHFADESSDSVALENLAKQWAAVDLVEAFAWAIQLPADEEWRRDRVMKGIATAWSPTAPEDAARLVSEQINPDSNLQIDAAMTVLRQWAARDYAGAAAWVDRFPDGWMRERGKEELAKAASSQKPSETKSN